MFCNPFLISVWDISRVRDRRDGTLVVLEDASNKKLVNMFTSILYVGIHFLHVITCFNLHKSVVFTTFYEACLPTTAKPQAPQAKQASLSLSYSPFPDACMSGSS